MDRRKVQGVGIQGSPSPKGEKVHAYTFQVAGKTMEMSCYPNAQVRSAKNAARSIIENANQTCCQETSMLHEKLKLTLLVNGKRLDDENTLHNTFGKEQPKYFNKERKILVLSLPTIQESESEDPPKVRHQFPAMDRHGAS